MPGSAQHPACGVLMPNRRAVSLFVPSARRGQWGLLLQVQVMTSGTLLPLNPARPPAVRKRPVGEAPADSSGSGGCAAAAVFSHVSGASIRAVLSPPRVHVSADFKSDRPARTSHFYPCWFCDS